jgi:hypothetical protein
VNVNTKKRNNTKHRSAKPNNGETSEKPQPKEDRPFSMLAQFVATALSETRVRDQREERVVVALEKMAGLIQRAFEKDSEERIRAHDLRRYPRSRCGNF